MSSFIDPLRDTFRKWLGISFEDTDRKLKADSERAAEVLDERAAALIGKVYSDAAAKFDRRMAEHRKQFDEAEPLTFDGVFEEIPAPAALAAPAKPEPEAAASATPPPAAAPEPPAPEQAVPEPPEQRATPKAKKKPATVKGAAKAPASAMPTEPPAPEEAAPSPKMDDAALAAAILKQSERREAGKRK
jgi:hypothetical protein